MFKHFCLVAAVCFLFGQCAGTVKIMPEYKKMNIEKSKLGIILIRENLTISNSNDIAKYLGNGETKQIFYDFFTSEFKEFAEQDGGFAEVNVVSGCETSGFTEISKYISSKYLSPDNYVYIRDPARKVCLVDGFQYLLILDDIDVAREKKSGGTVLLVKMYGKPMVMRPGDSDKLIINGKFVLWDNTAGKIAAFGKIDGKTDVISPMTKNTWINFVENISSEVFSNLTDGMPVDALD